MTRHRILSNDGGQAAVLAMRPAARAAVAGSLVCLSVHAAAQEQEAVGPSFPSDDPVIRAIWEEGVERSRVMELGQVMMDVIGPRLTGSPGMAAANDWSVAKFEEWGIEAYKEEYGTWRGWDRGISHIDLVSPRVRTLEGMAAAWSPATEGPVEAGVVILADADTPEAFEAWLPKRAASSCWSRRRWRAAARRTTWSGSPGPRRSPAWRRKRSAWSRTGATATRRGH